MSDLRRYRDLLAQLDSLPLRHLETVGKENQRHDQCVAEIKRKAASDQSRLSELESSALKRLEDGRHELAGAGLEGLLPTKVRPSSDARDVLEADRQATRAGSEVARAVSDIRKHREESRQRRFGEARAREAAAEESKYRREQERRAEEERLRREAEAKRLAAGRRKSTLLIAAGVIIVLTVVVFVTTRVAAIGIAGIVAAALTSAAALFGGSGTVSGTDGRSDS